MRGSLLLVAILLGCAVIAQGQPEVGLQVPPLLLPTFLVSYTFSGTQVELNVSYQSSGQNSVLGLGANGKLLLPPPEEAPLAVTPFLGVGARISRVSIHLVGQTFSTMVASVSVLFGAEYTLPDSRAHLFAEAGIALSWTGIGLTGVVGARLPLPW